MRLFFGKIARYFLIDPVIELIQVDSIISNFTAAVDSAFPLQKSQILFDAIKSYFFHHFSSYYYFF